MSQLERVFKMQREPIDFGKTRVEKLWERLSRLTTDYIEARDMCSTYSQIAASMRHILAVAKTWPVPDPEHVEWLENSIMVCETEMNDWDSIAIATARDMDKVNEKIQLSG